MNKSKLSIHAFNPLQSKSLIANYHQSIDKVIVGNNHFGLRQVSNFSLDDIKVVVDFAAKFDIDVFVCVNRLIHEADLIELTAYLHDLANLNVSGLIFSDLAVKYIVAEENLQFKLIYSTETTITNSSFSQFANENQIDGIELAKEINLAEVNEIASNKKSQISVQIHGHMYMYQSLRKMVDNFSQFQKLEMKTDNDMYLFDEERNNYYPLIQNEQGTHMLASTNMVMIHKLDELDLENIDSLRIDPLLYTPSQYGQIVKLYVLALEMINDNKELYAEQKRQFLKELKAIKQNQKYSTGFFYKKTMF